MKNAFGLLIFPLIILIMIGIKNVASCDDPIDTIRKNKRPIGCFTFASKAWHQRNEQEKLETALRIAKYNDMPVEKILIKLEDDLYWESGFVSY